MGNRVRNVWKPDHEVLTKALKALQSAAVACESNCGHDFTAPHGILSEPSVAKFLATKLGVGQHQSQVLSSTLGKLGLRTTKMLGPGKSVQLVDLAPHDATADPQPQTPDDLAAFFAEFDRLMDENFRLREDLAERDATIAGLRADAEWGQRVRAEIAARKVRR